MKLRGVNVDNMISSVGQMSEEGKTPLWVAIDGELNAVIAVADTIKPNSIKAIRQMHDAGLRVVMLTGDNEQNRSRYCTSGRHR